MRYAVPLFALVCSLAPATAMHAQTPVQPGADQARMLQDVDARLATNKQ